MTQLLDKLNIRDLSVAERIQLVGEIWNSIAEDGEEIEITEAQWEEIERRLQRYRENPEIMIPWDAVKARIQDRL
jgi:putative addiction module component (TIGR02574 family)